MHLFILGLRRSGTTIFWESFRTDSRLVCYDEPFNPRLSELPAPEPKGTRDEWIALYRRDPTRFRASFAPIRRGEELAEGLSAAQGAYLDFVLCSAEHSVLDMTRCHFKIESLRQRAPDAFLVHLYRSAAAWATSHLAPRAATLPGRLRAGLQRTSFFRRRGRYNNWGIEDLIGRELDSLFARRCAEAGLDPAAVYGMPALGRTLAYWKVHYERAERDGRRCFGERFLPVAFEDFCRDPAGVVAAVYDLIGMRPPEAPLPRVHPAHGAYRPGDPRWLRYGARVGLTPETGLLF